LQNNDYAAVKVASFGVYSADVLSIFGICVDAEISGDREIAPKIGIYWAFLVECIDLF
jgi:hypothetical protein